MAVLESPLIPLTDLVFMPLPNPLEQLRVLDISSADFTDQIVKVLCGEEYKRCIPDLQNGSLEWLVEFLDNVRPCSLQSTFTHYDLGNKHAQSNRPCVLELFDRAQRDMWSAGDTTEVVHNFGRPFEYE